MSLVNHLASHVGNEHLGNTDAFGRLVVLEDGCDDAGQGEGGAVEGVAEFCLACSGAAYAALLAVSLICVEV